MARPGTAHHRRGTEVRRVYQRETPQAEVERGHTHHVGHPHSAYPAVLAHGCPRHEHHPHATPQPLPHPDGAAVVRQRSHCRRHQLRDEPQRTGVFRQRPHQQPACHCRPHTQICARCKSGDRPRTDAARRTGENSDGIHELRLRRAALHHHRGERHRHIKRQHHHHQRCPPLRTE